MKRDKTNKNFIDKIDAVTAMMGDKAAPDDQELAHFAAEKRRFKDITRLVSDWIWETDQQFRLTYVSLRVMDVLGFHPFSLKNRTLNDLGRFILENGETSVVDWNKPFRDQLYVTEDSDGEARYFLISGVPVYVPKTGEFVGVRGTAEDVTQRHKTEFLLHQSEERYRTLYRKSPVMAYSTDASGLVTSVSDHLLANLGYMEDEFIGQSATGFMPKDFRDLFRASEDPNYAGDGQSRDIECQFHKKDGDIVDVVISTINEVDDHQNIVQSLNVVIDVTERKHYESVLLRQANYDFLTGLPNRGLAMDRLSQAFGRANRSQKSVALLFLDLDKFKKVNDTFGHAVGDKLLCEVSERIHTCIRECDTIARLGGDEFLVILPDLDSGVLSEVVARKILLAFEQPFTIGQREMVVTTSIGMAIYPSDETEPEQLLRSADAAMYRAKAGGRNNFRFYAGDTVDQGYDEHLTMENCLRRALDQNELFLEYQPVVDSSDKKIIGFETLVRWESPELGLVYPDRFIPMAEDTGLIVSIGKWVLEEACWQAQEWSVRFNSPLTVAVNVSPRQFLGPNMVHNVTEILTKTGLKPSCLELEITENLLVDDGPETLAIMQTLSAMGVRLSIDDFGTGYSSLSILKRFPFNTLKIDKAFVDNVTEDVENGALTKAIIAMAHGLGLKVTAEGVETQEQLAFMEGQNCDSIQGYYFGRPMNCEAFTDVLKDTHLIAAE